VVEKNPIYARAYILSPDLPQRQGGEERARPSDEGRSPERARAPLPRSGSGKGLAEGRTAWGEARRCRGGATRDGDLSQAEARSRPDEPKPKPAERTERGATGKGAFMRLLALAERRSETARASGRAEAGGRQAHRVSGRAPIDEPAGEQADKGSEVKARSGFRARPKERPTE
jgi:hypothetical protein